MRLLNKYTKEFKWFPEAPPGGYYILSHRWHGEETTMQSFALTRHLPMHQLSPGDAKVHKFCEVMYHEPLEYVWVDTCCIDKTSSSELQEAINSMYKWYEQAAKCVVYLDDVDSLEGSSRNFGGSAWFTRGWCLQELLAPTSQLYLDSRWQQLGDRSQIQDRIEEITGIQSMYLGDATKIRSASVAERMSWQSRRVTTRAEDIAYALLGIFDINMSMLYGEGGDKAFLRLQKEILANSNDESIFVWRAPPELYTGHSGLLAPHPNCFQLDVARDVKNDRYIDRAPYRMTNKGIEIQKFDRVSEKFWETTHLNLNCKHRGRRVQIQLIKADGVGLDGNIWLRSDPSALSTVEDRTVPFVPSDRETFRQWQAEQMHHNFAAMRSRHTGRSASGRISSRLDNNPFDRYDIYVQQKTLDRKPTANSAEPFREVEAEILQQIEAVENGEGGTSPSIEIRLKAGNSSEAVKKDDPPTRPDVLDLRSHNLRAGWKDSEDTMVRKHGISDTP